MLLFPNRNNNISQESIINIHLFTIPLFITQVILICQPRHKLFGVRPSIILVAGLECC